MLSSNNMLTTGSNNRSRQCVRQSVRVSQPAYGFFITGSCITGMNGVYVRKNCPSPTRSSTAASCSDDGGNDDVVVKEEDEPHPRAAAGTPVLYYQHEDGLWTMTLNTLPTKSDNSKKEDDDEEDDDCSYYNRRYTTKKKVNKTHAWFILDEYHKERFIHDGDTIVPGAGIRWNHVPASGFIPLDDSSSDNDEEDYNNNPYSFGRRRGKREKKQPSSSATATDTTSSTTTTLSTIDPPNEDELPWQVIAILDVDMVHQLLYSSKCRKERVRASMAGNGCAVHPPPTKSLECTFHPGRWLFRVICKDGVILYTTPSSKDSREHAGTRKHGEYVRGVELQQGDDGNSLWLKLDVDEDRGDGCMGSSMAARDFLAYGYLSNHNFDYTHSRRNLWVCIEEGVNGTTTRYLEELNQEDSPVLDIKHVGDDTTTPSSDAATANLSLEVVDSSSIAEPDGGSSLSGDLFDRPFIPRVGNVSTNTSNADSASSLMLLTSVRAGVDDDVVCNIQAQAHQSQRNRHTVIIPPGEAVTITGLATSNEIQYNNVDGVVITSLDVNGRQGIRLNTPFSGKVISIHPCNIVLRPITTDDESDTIIDMKNDASKAALVRASRLLGIRMSRLGLCAPASTSVGAGTWGFGGDSYISVINAAERAAVRELGHGHNSPVALSSIYSAGDLLRSTQPTHPFVPMSSCPNTPMAALRSGCLGAVAASAIVAAMSTTSSTERISGTNALRKLIQSEQIRGDRDFFQATTEEEDDNEKSPVDILLFRLALTEALLHDRRDGNATVEVKNAVQSLNPNLECPPAYLLLGRCLLRQGARVEGLSAIETAEKWTVNKDMQHFPLWLKPMWEWSANEASRLLTVHKASESARTSAVDAYARGSFTDAALLYGRSIKLLNIGLPDDKRGRATALSDKAGCHRRERKLDAAITELDMALALFPRYSRALFRRGACLLEKGDAEGAIDSFKSLYRVDRAWHNLSDWLVRAFTLQKRQKQGYKGGDRGNYDETQKSTNSTNDDHTASNNGGGVNQEAAKIASQVDHYAVLGVTVDATEKQLKNAYRMMSLKYHPDKPTGNTAAFQRIATAFETLSDPEKRLAFDEGGDIKVKRGGKDDDDSDEEDEEHKTTMKEEVEREFYPERYHFWPFGDPFIQKRKHMAQKAKAEAEKARQSSSRRDGSKSWQDEDHYW